MIATHAVQIDGRTWMELKPTFDTEMDGVSRLLSRMDGREHFSLVLWRLPNGRHFADTDPDKEAKEYIQAAGSSEQMSLEVRRSSKEGADQLVIGRPAKTPLPNPSTDLHWSDYTLRVHPHELFGAPEAVALFDSYFRTGSVPPGYTLRKLNL